MTVLIDRGFGRAVAGQKDALIIPSKWKPNNNVPIVALCHGSALDADSWITWPNFDKPKMIAERYGLPCVAADQDAANAVAMHSEANALSQTNAMSAITWGQNYLGTKVGNGSALLLGGSMGTHMAMSLYKNNPLFFRAASLGLVSTNTTASYNASKGHSYGIDFTGVDYLATPDSAALTFIDTIEIIAQLALDDWTPLAAQSIVSKYGAAGQRSWNLTITTAGKLQLVTSTDGTATIGSSTNTSSSIALPVALTANAATLWIRVVFTGTTLTFYYSTDGVSWVQLGAVRSLVNQNIFDSTADLRIGQTGAGASPLSGQVFYVSVSNIVGGPPIAEFDPNVIVFTGDQSPTTWVDAQGNTWTATGTGWKWLPVGGADSGALANYIDTAFADEGGWPAAAPTNDPWIYAPQLQQLPIWMGDTIDDPTNGGQAGVQALAARIGGNQCETHFFGTGGHDLTKIPADQMAAFLMKHSGLS